MTYADFKQRLAEYCETYEISRSGIRDENYKTAFQQAGIMFCDADAVHREAYLKGIGVRPAEEEPAAKRARVE